MRKALPKTKKSRDVAIKTKKKTTNAIRIEIYSGAAHPIWNCILSGTDVTSLPYAQIKNLILLDVTSSHQMIRWFVTQVVYLIKSSCPDLRTLADPKCNKSEQTDQSTLTNAAICSTFEKHRFKKKHITLKFFNSKYPLKLTFLLNLAQYEKKWIYEFFSAEKAKT